MFHSAKMKAWSNRQATNTRGRVPLPPAQDARLRGLLQPKGPQTKQQQQQKAAAAASAAQPSQQHQVQQSAQAAFRSLPATEQRSKVERWSLMDSADLAAALRQYPADAGGRVGAGLCMCVYAACWGIGAARYLCPLSLLTTAHYRLLLCCSGGGVGARVAAAGRPPAAQHPQGHGGSARRRRLPG